jgi:hypothetical protein
MLNENKMTQYFKKKTWMEKNTIKKDLNKKKRTWIKKKLR